MHDSQSMGTIASLLCDLHVYKVPPDLWRENFNNILNNVVTETISIGIIRVPSETRLADLRDEIIQQLQPDDMGPRDWVFLRSVGRSLTRLRTKQEYQLKAKHFLPPVVSL
ncbi:spermatogenesis-associated protein 1 [Elysia marginata]|uniref:Spermatogenesis-associated protein 1 n=1 Tax=Elysia marginata TaxID=1093978 RepID=A0AAV4HA07_9GAST|nr:spermatogenesis-associated protein 1 [Elysia marginata]